MKTVFLSGSRKIGRLNKDVCERLTNIMEQGLSVIVGDASGVDRAVQQYLFDHSYPSVTVFCSGEHCRNNVGNWATKNIAVDKKLRGRDFYTQKDKAMAAEADYGFIFWDGKSQGSITNVLELVKNDKKSLVYFHPEKAFYKILNIEDANELIGHCDQALVRKLKDQLAALLPEEQVESQVSFGF